MKVYQEIDIQNPFQMGDLLCDSAWDNLYLIQQNDRLCELEDILESYGEMSIGDLNYFLDNEVLEIFPEIFGDDDDSDDE